MNRYGYIAFLILMILTVHSVEADAIAVGQDSLRTVLSEKISEMHRLDEYITTPVNLKIAQKDLDILDADMERIYQLHYDEINNNIEVLSQFEKYTSIRQQLENRINDILIQYKKDSILESLQEKIISYDSLYQIGKRFSSEKKGDSIVMLKQHEAGRWVEVQIMSNGNMDLIQSNVELQKQLDSLTYLHEQITMLPEKKSKSIGQILMMIFPIIMSMVAIAMVVKVEIDKSKAKKQAAEAQKQALENARKAQEEAMQTK